MATNDVDQDALAEQWGAALDSQDPEAAAAEGGHAAIVVLCRDWIRASRRRVRVTGGPLELVF